MSQRLEQAPPPRVIYVYRDLLDAYLSLFLYLPALLQVCVCVRVCCVRVCGCVCVCVCLCA